MIRILLVDDQPLIRSGFRALLDLEDDIEVVTEAADGSQALTLARRYLPDIALIDRQMPVLLINRYVSQPLTPIVSAAQLNELTVREREAVTLVARGMTNDEITRSMVISPLTAKTHINRAMTNLHARDRAQLVVLAYESGLVAPRNL
ncbi:response regulator transcription factor [Nocardia sp. NPDC051321]|uniref:response regulator transcription factor n=1 Tax=Nocardia sp. NPDC051321 TaxID=3364323 RepID=UPI0037B56611